MSNRDVQSEEFDYDISNIDVDERAPVARTNFDSSQFRTFSCSSVVYSSKWYAVRNPNKNNYRNDDVSIKKVGNERNKVFA